MIDQEKSIRQFSEAISEDTSPLELQQIIKDFLISEETITVLGEDLYPKIYAAKKIHGAIVGSLVFAPYPAEINFDSFHAVCCTTLTDSSKLLPEHEAKFIANILTEIGVISQSKEDFFFTTENPLRTKLKKIFNVAS